MRLLELLGHAGKHQLHIAVLIAILFTMMVVVTVGHNYRLDVRMGDNAMKLEPANIVPTPKAGNSKQLKK